MKLDKDNLAKILSLWLHVEALTPFDLDKNDLIEQMPGSLNQPRSSLFTWDNEDTTQRDSLEIELQKLPKEEDRTDFFRMFTVCIGIVSRNEFIDRAEHLLRSNLLDISQDLSDFSAEEQRTDDLICLGVLRANHFGKISMGTVEPSYALCELVNLTNKQKGVESFEFLTDVAQILHTSAVCQLSLDSETTAQKISEKDRQFYGMLIHNLNKKELKPDETRGYKLIKDLNPPQNFLNPRKIDELCKSWLEKAGLGPSYRIWVIVNYYERPKPLYFDFMNSPYIEILEKIKKRVQTEPPTRVLSPVSERFFSLAYDNPDRNDLLANSKKFLEMANPERMIFGRWPSDIKNYLVPCQQVALSTMIWAPPVDPIISTTFASAAFRFNNFLSSSLPWVIVDEASQATPQSALLLMQKAKRFLVVGDPLQLTPVVTLPDSLSELLCGKEELLRKWSPHLHSLQQLADGANPFGAFVGPEEHKIWSGLPLRLQRRSYPPMFNICNRIAYSGQMVLPPEMKVDKTPERFIESYWVDVVPARPSLSNCVSEEVDAAEEVLNHIDVQIAMKHLQGEVFEKKSVLICTPFRTAAATLRKRIKKTGNWLEVERIGTVHTLQGRQSDIVIVVLGSKTNKDGFGARNWATSTPNLLNVAVSRAKETVIFIGNYEDWKEHNYVPTIMAELEDYGKGRLKLSEVLNEPERNN